jgi:hypothetical protein
MLTAAVRELHKAYPKQFKTDIETSVPELFENNPYITSLKWKKFDVENTDEEVRSNEEMIHEHKFKIRKFEKIEIIKCVYDGEFPASINYCNSSAYHFIHGYLQDLENKLGIRIPMTEFNGDIHLSDEERGWMSQIEERGIKRNFWILMAGGKFDFTTKWWDPQKYQKIVDHFRKKILFVQCGEKNHFHPKLKGVLNLVGKTDIRQFVRLMYHSVGVICPITFAMHLAAATPMRDVDNFGNRLPNHRPCIVIAGGREPVQWEAYPFHQYLHRVGTMWCCNNGGCWKSRCQKVGDNDKSDVTDFCPSPVKKGPISIAKCMDMISAEEVIEKIEMYYSGDVLKYT